MQTTNQIFRHGVQLLEQGRFMEALGTFDSVTRAAPMAAAGHHLRGIALHRLDRNVEAEEALVRAARLAPDTPDILANRALVRLALQRNDEAAADGEAALRLAPNHIGALNNLGLARLALGETTAALATFERLLAVAPHFISAYENKGNCLLALGRPAEAEATYRQAMALAPDNLGSRCVHLFALNYLDSADPAMIAEAARDLGDRVARDRTPFTHVPDPARSDRPVRIGFVSGDLRDHAVSQFLLAVLPDLSARLPDLHAYATSTRFDAVSERLRPFFKGWHNIARQSDAAAADHIRRDGIDILIDLSGPTTGGRLGLFALKPAPLQVSWLGYSGTTGLRSIDYVIADDRVLPPELEEHFVERPLRLGRPFLCFRPSIAAPARTPSGVTFGSFNTLNKLGDACVAAWARILTAVPEASLLLKSRELADAATRDAVLRRFELQGIDPTRLRLLAWTPRREDHIALYGEMTLALDTFPYAGTTTTMEALTAGVPVLTLGRGTFANRVGDTILTAAGLSAWIARDIDDYVAKAVAVARDPTAIPGDIRERVLQSPLCDSVDFAAAFASALEGVWRSWCLSAPPDEAMP